MYLYIDTTDQQELTVSLYDTQGAEMSSSTIEAPYKHGEVIHEAIENILTAQSLTTSDLEAILVKSGPGPFSATRTGVAVANAGAWSLDIPVIEVDSVDSIGAVITSYKQREAGFGHIVEPVYSEEPNISTRKT